MSSVTITNVLDFIYKEFAKGHLVSADITANPNGLSEIHSVYINPVTEFENCNRTKKPIRDIVEELEYEDAHKAILYLLENANKIHQRNPSIHIDGLPITEHVLIRKDIVGFFEESFYIDVSEKTKSDEEKFEYLIHYLKKFMRHILDIYKEKTSIDRITFGRSIISNARFHKDITSIYYKNGEIEIEEFNSNEIEHPYKLGSFYSGLFTGLNIEAALSWKPESDYDFYVSFSDGETNGSIKLLGEKSINDGKNSMSLKSISNEKNPDLHVYHITGNILDIAL